MGCTTWGRLILSQVLFTFSQVLTVNQELRADECVEDIFAGGDGWGSRLHQSKNPTLRPRGSNISHDEDIMDDDHDYRNRSGRHSTDSSPRKGLFRSHHNKPNPSQSRMDNSRRGDSFHRHFVRDSQHGSNGQTHIDHQSHGPKKVSKHGKRPLLNHEVDEFSNPWRDDLSSWKVRPSTTAQI